MSDQSWWKLKDGNYIRSGAVTMVYTEQEGSNWELEVDVPGTASAPAGLRLAGSWANQAAAQEAARELVHGIDPSTFD